MLQMILALRTILQRKRLNNEVLKLVFIHNKHLCFFIVRGCSDDLFIKLATRDADSLSDWMSFKSRFQEKDIKTAIKLIKSRFKHGLSLKDILEIIEVEE